MKCVTSKGFLSLFWVAALMISISGCYLEGRNPPDADLEKQFREKVPDFDRLVKMAIEDTHIVRLTNDYYQVDNNNSDEIRAESPRFSLSRWNEYRALFHELDLRDGLMRWPGYPGTIFILPFGNEPMRVDAKGYAYSAEPISPVRGSLDDPRTIKGFVFKHLTGNWYLFAIGKGSD